MPGGDAREAAKTVTGTFEDFAFLPELPARGPGADMIGRTVGLLVELYAHVEPSGWRISDRPGRDTRRARSWLGEDLDALEEFTQGYEGPLKVAGGRARGRSPPRWSCGTARPRSATRAPAGTSPAPSRRGCARISRTYGAGCPAPSVVLQLDEPSLTAVLRGQVQDRQRLPHPPGRRPAGRRGRAAGRRSACRRRARRRALVRAATSRSRCCGGPAPRASPSTSRCSPSVTTTRSVRRSRAVRRCSPASCRRTGRPHCQTLPVASWVSGRCGAGWG